MKAWQELNYAMIPCGGSTHHVLWTKIFNALSLTILQSTRHIAHALLEGPEAAKASGLSEKNPSEQARPSQLRATIETQKQFS